MLERRPSSGSVACLIDVCLINDGGEGCLQLEWEKPGGREVSSHGDTDQKPKGLQDLGKTWLDCFLSMSHSFSLFLTCSMSCSSYSICDLKCFLRAWYSGTCV